MSVHAFRCSETSVAVSCFERLAPQVPGTQAIVYDTALRGVHHQTILRELGFVPVNMVAAAETFGSKTLKRKIKRNRTADREHAHPSLILPAEVVTTAG